MCSNINAKNTQKFVGNQFPIISCLDKDVLRNVLATSSMFFFYVKGYETDMKMKSWPEWKFK
jgi:hypothetical protein